MRLIRNTHKIILLRDDEIPRFARDDEAHEEHMGEEVAIRKKCPNLY